MERFLGTRSSTRESRARSDGDRTAAGRQRRVLFFIAVDDVEATLKRAEELGGTTIQPAQSVPGVSFGVFADAQGHVVGVAAN